MLHAQKDARRISQVLKSQSRHRIRAFMWMPGGCPAFSTNNCCCPAFSTDTSCCAALSTSNSCWPALRTLHSCYPELSTNIITPADSTNNSFCPALSTNKSCCLALTTITARQLHHISGGTGAVSSNCTQHILTASAEHWFSRGSHGNKGSQQSCPSMHTA
jgi:hypothetical protein